LAQQAQPWRRHKPRWLEVELQSRSGQYLSGLMGISFVSSVKTPPPTTLEAAKMMPHVCVKIAQNVKYKLPIQLLERKRETLLVRTGTPTGLNEDGTTILAQAFDIDEYDYGYFVIWTDGIQNTNTAAFVNLVVADVWVRGMWFVTERVDTPAPSIAVSVGPMADHYQFTQSLPVADVGSFVIPSTDFLPLSVNWAKTTASTLGTTMVDSASTLRDVTFPKNGVYLCTMKVTDRQVSPGVTAVYGQTALEGVTLNRHGAGSDYREVLYDNSTGDTAGLEVAGFFPCVPLQAQDTHTFSAASMIIIEIDDFKNASLRILATDNINGVRTGGTGILPIGAGFDLVITEMPQTFARKKETAADRMAVLEKKVAALSAAGIVKDSKDQKSRVVGKDEKTSFVNEAAKRRAQLRSVMRDELSPTESLAGWVDSSLAVKLGQVKDQKDEKDRKGKG